MKNKIDVRNPETLLQVQEEIREAYRAAYTAERMVLARCLAMKLRDYNEQLQRAGKPTPAQKRQLEVLAKVLN